MKLVVFTGAGVSAESGVRTFRDSGGLWEGYRVQDVATPEAWRENPQRVLSFYNERRKQLKEVTPNAAHMQIALWEKDYDVIVVTQNVDNLHERAGSSEVLHLHGELTKVRSERYHNLIYHWEEDLNLGDFCEKGTQLRPHIVWFGEAVPKMEEAINLLENADVYMIIGTSLQVYPAASLYQYVPEDCSIFYIDPKPGPIYDKRVEIIAESAVQGIVIMNEILRNRF